MTDVKTIMSWLEGLAEPDWSMYHSDSEVQTIAKETLVLLKSQEKGEPKTGHWIYLEDCANKGVYCSECHTKMFDRYPMKKKLSQFCGHCGAKMDEKAEGL